MGNLKESIEGGGNIQNNGEIVIKNQIPCEIILSLVQLANRLLDERKELMTDFNLLLKERQQLILPNYSNFN